MSVRPSMHTRDASGRQVSLLNDEPKQAIFRHPSYSTLDSTDQGRAGSYISSASSPRTPDLLRADSYDSQMSSNAPQSPLTPSSLSDFGGRQSSYTSAYPDPTQYDQRSIYGVGFQEKRMPPSLPMVRPAYERPQSFDEASYQAAQVAQADRAVTGKRYPCRFRDSHGCDKTFTTSGHASRHSKIHTAEKAVHCAHAGCTKKFTRADNMKQHLETHYKKPPRSAAAGNSAPKSVPSKLTMPAGVKKSSGRPSRPSSRTSQRPSISSFDSYGQYSEQYSPLDSPATPHETLDMAHFQGALPPNAGAHPPMHTRTSSDSYRLDALAAICSNGH